MFHTANVPCVDVVENMAYYELEKSSSTIDQEKLKQIITDKLIEQRPESTGDRTLTSLPSTWLRLWSSSRNKAVEIPVEFIIFFGPRRKERLSEQWGIEHNFSVPLLDGIATNGDSGKPYMFSSIPRVHKLRYTRN
jgi:hypothetical protein